MARSADGFDSSVPLPPGLTIAHLRNAIDFVEEKAEELIDLYFEQANVFSGVVGILGIRALDSFSPYKRHKHPDTAQQRFPDLSLRGRAIPPPEQAAESKGSTRQWAIQSHYNHAGWYIIWRYGIDPTRKMKKGRRVLIWRIDIPFLNNDDWKYEGRGKNPYLRREAPEQAHREFNRLFVSQRSVSTRLSLPDGAFCGLTSGLLKRLGEYDQIIASFSDPAESGRFPYI